MIKHLIIDGSNFFMRAFYTKSKDNSKGINVGSLTVFIDMMDRILKHFNPINVVVVWDIGKSHKRLELFPEYKGHRKSSLNEDEFQNMLWQKEQIKKILDLLAVRQLGVDGIEADDIIGYINTKLFGKKVIVSNDRDFIQLVDKRTDLFLPNKGRLITYRNVEEFLGFPLQYFVLSKAISGDKSDNIKNGIPKFGEVRTKKLILEGIKKGSMNIPEEFEPVIKLNTILMTIGLILDEKDHRKIVRNYKNESNKTINAIELKNLLIDLELKKIVRTFSTFIAVYKKLRK